MEIRWAVLFRCKISKRFTIITAYSTSGTEPNNAGFIFINRHNQIIEKSLPCCEMLKGFLIVIINSGISGSEPKVSTSIFQKIPESARTNLFVRLVNSFSSHRKTLPHDAAIKMMPFLPFNNKALYVCAFHNFFF